MLGDMLEVETQFSVGDVIRHQRFGYRGVIVDVDPVCRASDEWYEAVARSRPPRDAPWYQVLVHDAVHTTYVAERNLERDSADAPIRHPLLREFFDECRKLSPIINKSKCIPDILHMSMRCSIQRRKRPTIHSCGCRFLL